MNVDEELIRSTLAKEFDARYYRSQVPGFANIKDPLSHYINTGWNQGLDPAPWFSTSGYLRQYPDVAEAGINPFFHYLFAGRAEKRSPKGAGSIDALPEDVKFEIKTIETSFDPVFYRAQLPAQPAIPDKDLLRHFVTKGWRAGLDPAADFSTSLYLSRHKDVAKEGMNPIFHYIVSGRGEGREIAPSSFVQSPPQPAPPPTFSVIKTRRAVAAPKVEKVAAATPAEPEKLDHVITEAIVAEAPALSIGEDLSEDAKFEIKTIAPSFDPVFYRAQLPAQPVMAEDELLRHFVTTGWRAGLDPSADFSTALYLRRYDDIAAAGINPFFHYLVAGKSEKRVAVPSAFAAKVEGPVEVLASGVVKMKRPTSRSGQVLPASAAPPRAAPRPTDGDVPRAEDFDDLPDEIKFEIRTIAPSFDPAFYRAQLPAQPTVADRDLLRHFVTKGWRAGLDPAANFSTTLYLRRNKDVAYEGLNPIFHYQLAGKAEGREASPSTFVPRMPMPVEMLARDVTRIVAPATVADSQSKPGKPQPAPVRSARNYAGSDGISEDVIDALLDPLFFDTDFYRATYGLNGSDTEILADYLKNPQRAASPYFDPVFYRSHGENMGEGPFAELLHYLAVGKAKGLHPSPIFDGTKIVMSADQIAGLIESSGLFDRDWYLYKNGDVARSSADPLLHYAKVGHVEQRRSPNLLFDAKYYAIHAADLHEYRWNPLVHYIILGSKKKLKTSQLFDAERIEKIYAAEAGDRNALFIQLQLAPRDGLGPNEYFDPWHYVRLCPDAQDFPGGPLSHYLEIGWKEGRDPSANFSTNGYFQANPDVRALNANPYLHFLQLGQMEGRSPNPRLRPVPSELERFGDPEYGASGPVMHYDQEFHLPRNFGLSIAVHLHLYYVEMAEEFCEYLSHIPGKFNLFISVPPGRGDPDEVRSVFSAALDHCLSVTVSSPPNRGRDVGPFLVEFGQAILAHDLVLHLHSKRSPHSAKHAGWRRYLLHHVLANRSIVTQILSAFHSDPSLGVFQPPYHPEVRAQPKWGNNRERVSQLLSRLGMSYAGEACLDFPAGSFFWARTDAIRPLLEGRIRLEDFDEEAGQIDGTLAHALERLFGIVPVQRGYSVASRFIDIGYNLIHYHGKARSYAGFERDRSADIRRYQDAIATRGSARARIAVVTAIVGPFDALLLPEKLEPEIDYYCVTDSISDGYGVFRIQDCPYVDADPRRTARYVKTNLVRLFPGYDYIVWIDGNVLAHKSIVEFVARVEASKAGLGLIPHPIRHSYADEAAEVSRHNLDDAELIAQQVEQYRSVEGMDESVLIETNFMVLDARQPEVRDFQRLWWNEINTFSRRDQLSINYCMIKSGATWMPVLPEFQSTRDSKEFSLFRHGLNEWGPKPHVYASWHDKGEFDGRLPPLEDIFRWQKTAGQLDLDVVVCVHNAPDDVKACLPSVAAALRGRGSIIIVDDASDAPTRRYLDEFVAQEGAALIRHHERSGYTVSANDGVRAARSKYVLLLNSDTIVPDGALDKIVDALERNPLLGIVGPLSNAASSQSVPSIANSGTQTAINPIPSGMTVADLDHFLERRSDGRVVRTPLVHGFCFCVKREVFETIGYFDDENFPRGYGEENDFCFRAVDAGFDLGVATNAYIFHAKSKSYSDGERSQLMEEGMQALVRKHGRARISRSVQTMNSQPALEAARTAVAALFDRPEVPMADKRRLFLLPAQRSDGLPTGSAFVRVLYPYRHPTIQEKWDISVSYDGALPSLRPEDVIVVQRDAGAVPQHALAAWLTNVAASGARLVYEIDDDLLDGAALQARGFKGDVDELAGRVMALARQADCITVSSQALFNKFSRINAGTRLVHNALDERLWGLSEARPEAISKLEHPLRDDRIIIGYAGTPTHDEDLEIVRDAVSRLSDLFPGRIDFQMIGGVSHARKAFGKVIPLPVNNDYPNFVRWLRANVRWDIGIVPLADSAFNSNKSFLKFLEFSAMGMAVACSNASEYRHVVTLGETGLLVENTTRGWLEALQVLVRQPVERRRLAANALANVQTHHTLNAKSATVLDVLNG